MADTREAARRWATTWQRAWVASDIESIVELYAADAMFSSQPFRALGRGQAAIRDYVVDAFAHESDVLAWFAEPIVDGDRACVAWWASLREDGADTTLAGTSALRFDAAGRVVDQRDTWNRAAGRQNPPESWGPKV